MPVLFLEKRSLIRNLYLFYSLNRLKQPFILSALCPTRRHSCLTLSGSDESEDDHYHHQQNEGDAQRDHGRYDKYGSDQHGRNYKFGAHVKKIDQDIKGRVHIAVHQPHDLT